MDSFENNFSGQFGADLSDVALELERIGDLSDRVGRSLANALKGAVLDGKSLKTILADVSRALADVALSAAFKPVGTLVSGLIESLFTATNPTLGGIEAFAKGGVVAAPSYFALGDGQLGLAGETGPEAILPLARGPDGRLGVASAAGSAPININFTVQANDARSFAGAEAELSAMLLRAVKRGTRAS